MSADMTRAEALDLAIDRARLAGHDDAGHARCMEYAAQASAWAQIAALLPDRRAASEYGRGWDDVPERERSLLTRVLDGPALADVELVVCSAGVPVIRWRGDVRSTPDQPAQGFHPESRTWCTHPGEFMPFPGQPGISERHKARMLAEFGVDSGPTAKCPHGVRVVRASNVWRHVLACHDQYGEVCDWPDAP